ncbi:hypothetical protein SDRG_05667 [Saprolegnia diclina VS20]|uniref:Apple domain-containing protein n=1 Tax=Saprolegnia diclina (strain VS20) TaxID=1156394 RepID=T0QQ07_SAPDV|nr:hypothetical protein SDRG_05667 [Saprolegnia diclina VS20]EQC36836.1 hypothetical protein SDRG_05667 [Saprolegnia diclina VS20]|eukprot:XP_008609617.1 hypothetical protein SDRG_05667 [Saprolegnia diclina VS20]
MPSLSSTSMTLLPTGGGCGWNYGTCDATSTCCDAAFECVTDAPAVARCRPKLPPIDFLLNDLRAWKQCGGGEFDGDESCADGWSCYAWNQWFSECVPWNATTTESPPAPPTIAAIQRPSIQPPTPSQVWFGPSATPGVVQTSAPPTSVSPRPSSPPPTIAPSVAPRPTTKRPPTPTPLATPRATSSPPTTAPTVAPRPTTRQQPPTSPLLRSTVFSDYAIFTAAGSVLTEYYASIYVSPFAFVANAKWTYTVDTGALAVGSNGQCLAYQRTSDGRYRVQTLLCDAGQSSQAWRIDFRTYRIVQRNLGLCLDSPVAGVTLAPCNTGTTTQWVRLAAPSEFYAHTDFVNQDVASTPVGAAIDCVGKCGAMDACAAVVWTSTPTGGMCWLKSGYRSPVVSNGATAVVLTPPSLAVCQLLTLDVGIDYVGYDIGSVYADTPTDCCAPCTAMANCNAFSWADRTCYLKNARMVTSANAAVTSARVRKCSSLQDNVDFVGFDIGSAVAVAAEDCCSLCRNNWTCQAYVWSNDNGGTCWLKSARGAAQTKAGVRSSLVLF